MIKSNPDDPALLISLLNLTKELCNDEEVARKVPEMGGIKIILKVMKTNIDVAMVQVAACGVIGFFVLEGREEKNGPSLVKAIIDAMTKHDSVGEVQVHACDALFELSRIPATYGIFKEKKTKELLLHAKSHFKLCESDVDDIIATFEKEK